MILSRRHEYGEEHPSGPSTKLVRQGGRTRRAVDVKTCWMLFLFQDAMHYEQLTAGVVQHDLLVDSLIYKV